MTVSPQPTLILTSSSPIVCAGASVTFTVAGASSYSWHTGSANTANTLQINVSTLTTFSVTGTDMNGCSAIASITQSVTNCTNIKQVAQNNFNVNLFPNPNSGKFVIESDAFQTASDRVIILNALGAKVFESKLQGNQVSIDANLAKGLYHCQILRDQKVLYTRKMIVE
jgi:hypothetical protein